MTQRKRRRAGTGSEKHCCSIRESPMPGRKANRRRRVLRAKSGGGSGGGDGEKRRTGGGDPARVVRLL